MGAGGGWKKGWGGGGGDGGPTVSVYNDEQPTNNQPTKQTNKHAYASVDLPSPVLFEGARRLAVRAENRGGIK